MVFAEKRGLLTPEQRTLAWKKHDDDRLLARENVVGVIGVTDAEDVHHYIPIRRCNDEDKVANS